MRRSPILRAGVVLALVTASPLDAQAPSRVQVHPPARARAEAPRRTIAIDARLAADAHLRVGDLVVIAADAAMQRADTVRVGAIVQRRADPSEIARNAYHVRLHLDQLQQLTATGDRVDRFAVATRGAAATDSVVEHVNHVAFGFRAHRSRDVAAETSTTFEVVSRFHRAIGVITIVASAIFLLCILLLKVEERRRDVAALRLIGISRGTVLRAVVLEAAVVAAIGSAIGVGIGAAASAIVNAHYQGVYRTPLRFSIITGDVVLLAVSLSIALGVVAGALAAYRLVRERPLTLLGR
ncbi:MAG TPA: ABC transporter permease [Gemmatimonadaceae bacterium]|nr:ABC transporter permease [Gemmatimonadaceae bacterium]